MSRLQSTLEATRSRDEKAMGLFLTNGFPTPDATLPLLRAIDRGGADFIELGMPFSDPLGEGRPIQRSSARALQHGVTLSDAFRTVESFRSTSSTPVVLMGYVNPVFRYGVDRFCRDAASSGVDGLILPDVPPDESGFITEPAREHQLDVIFLIAPNTADDRIRRIDDLSSGFVYAVSITGLTGTDLGAVSTVDAYLKRARGLVRKNPLLVGFGITSHEDAARLSTHTDGFIVGSALINRIEALWAQESLSAAERLDEVRRFARQLRHGDSAVTPPSAEPSST